MFKREKVLFPGESYSIQEAIFDVYKEMGCGFLEADYQECLDHELSRRKIPFDAQVDLQLSYKGILLKQTYKPDFICYNKIIVEIKAVQEVTQNHKAQLLNYLKVANLELGMLVNFGTYPKAEIMRIASAPSVFQSRTSAIHRNKLNP